MDSVTETLKAKEATLTSITRLVLAQNQLQKVR